MNKILIYILLIGFTFSLTSLSSITEINSNSSVIQSSCTYKNKKLYGKIQFVKSHPDIKIQYVDANADIDVQMVKSMPNSCGKWQEVKSQPDLKVQIVNSFPDIKVRLVKSKPGMK